MALNCPNAALSSRIFIGDREAAINSPGGDRVNCPYCLEQINDGALVCRWCKRDLILTKPLSEKIAGLEKIVRTLRNEQIGGPPAVAPSPGQTSAVNKSAIALSANMCSFLGFYYISWLPFATIDKPWIALAFISPLVAAFLDCLRRICD
jgi:hypothetical protein